MSREVTREDVLDGVEDALAPLMDRTKERVKGARDLDQLADVYRDYVRERDLIIAPFLEIMHLLPMEPMIIPREQIYAS